MSLQLRTSPGSTIDLTGSAGFSAVNQSLGGRLCYSDGLQSRLAANELYGTSAASFSYCLRCRRSWEAAAAGEIFWSLMSLVRAGS